MAAVKGSVAAVNDFLESDEDDDLDDITTIVILLFILGTSDQNNFFKVPSCTDIKLKDIPEEVFEKCKEPDLVIHCLPDENDNLGLSCFSVTWIEAGRCPYYNSYQGNMDEKNCNQNHGQCSTGLYKSPFSLEYAGCYAKEHFATTIAVTTTQIETISPVKCPMNDSVANRTINTSSEIGEECTCATEIAVAIIVSLLVCGALLLAFKKWMNVQNISGSANQTSNNDKQVSIPLNGKA